MRKLLVRQRWPKRLQPVGVNTFDQEPFDPWWARNRGELEHLDPRVSEQWIHRHWDNSDYFGLPLATLTSTVERWATTAILSQVGCVDDRSPCTQPYFATSEFNRLGAGHEPARTMNSTGTWDYPILILGSPDGFAMGSDPFPNRRFWLVEGHLRFRHLRAMSVLKLAAHEHEVLVIRYPGRDTRGGRAAALEAASRS